MSRELWWRQQAMRLKYAGWSVRGIWAHVARSRDGFSQWWNRYLAEGSGGLRARAPAPHTFGAAWAPEVRQAIVTIRDRLRRRHGPRARYRVAGAPTIRHALAGLGSAPLPSLRPIARVGHAAGRPAPACRVQPCAVSVDSPGPHAPPSNAVQQLDLIGPRDVHGSRRQCFFLVSRDSYEQAVYGELQPHPKMDTVLAFGGPAWQRLGLPAVLQVDHRGVFGPTSHPGALNRLIRLALLVGVALTFIPAHDPWHNGAIEHCNGGLQARGFAIPVHSPTPVRCELAALMTTCFHAHIHPPLDFQTPAPVRHDLHVHTLPHTFRWHQQPLPLAIGWVVFLRRIRHSGCIPVLGVQFRLGKRFAHQYVTARLYTRTMLLTVSGRGLMSGHIC